MTIRVCLAGATGWAGSELARAIAGTEDIVFGMPDQKLTLRHDSGNSARPARRPGNATDIADAAAD